MPAKCRGRVWKQLGKVVCIFYCLSCVFLITKATVTKSECPPFYKTLETCFDHLPADVRKESKKYAGKGFVSSGMLPYVLSITSGPKLDDFCNSYKNFKSCKNYLNISIPNANCAIKREFMSLAKLDRIFQVICIEQRFAYRSNVKCIVGQTHWLLARRCDFVYNLQTFSTKIGNCRLINDLLGCYRALVESGCGPEAERVFLRFGHLRLDTSLLQKRSYQSRIPVSSSWKTPAAFKTCPRKADYRVPPHAFNYQKSHCRANFQFQLSMCHHRLSRASNIFFSDLPIARPETEHHLYGKFSRICQALKQYRACSHVARVNCPYGTNLIMATFHWKTTLIKLQYVCNNRKSYLASVTCLRAVNPAICSKERHISDSLLRQYWVIMCSANSYARNTSRIAKRVQQTIDCYKKHVVEKCSRTEANHLSNLLRIEFSMRQFELDCSGNFVWKNYTLRNVVSGAGSSLTSTNCFVLLAAVSLHVVTIASSSNLFKQVIEIG